MNYSYLCQQGQTSKTKQWEEKQVAEGYRVLYSSFWVEKPYKTIYHFSDTCVYIYMYVHTIYIHTHIAIIKVQKLFKSCTPNSGQ